MENTHNTMFTLGAAIVTGVVAIVIAVMALGRVDSYLRVKAVDECARSSRYERKNSDGSFTSHALPDHYKKCLQDKGMSE